MLSYKLILYPSPSLATQLFQMMLRHLPEQVWVAASELSTIILCEPIHALDLLKDVL